LSIQVVRERVSKVLINRNRVNAVALKGTIACMPEGAVHLVTYLTLSHTKMYDNLGDKPTGRHTSVIRATGVESKWAKNDCVIARPN